jgi:carotenoid cleavage dioxygenase-like enzyme
MPLVAQRIGSSIHPDNDNPFLAGPFKPMDTEYTITGDDLTVIGEIPRDLRGIFVRNAHNQVHEPLGPFHPFDGDGMLHAMRFEDGKAEYRNRYVRTTGFLAEQAAGKALWPGLMAPQLATRRGWGAIGAMKDNAGTDVVCHAGRLIATMSQCSEAWRIDPNTLETLGVDTSWGRKVPDGVSAHYKVDPATGEMMFFNYTEKPPFMNYGVVDRDNNLVHYTPIELPGARWPHDLGITKRFTVVHDLPLYFDPKGLREGRHELVFNRDQPARFGVLPRYGDNSQVKWFECTPCYVLHITNCYEDGDEVVMDGCIMPDYKKIPVGMHKNYYDHIRANLDKHNNPTMMHRWRFNMKTGAVKEQYYDDEITEFPVCSNDHVGRDYRYSYNVLYKKGDWLFKGVKRYDMKTGRMQRYEYGEGRYGSEPQVARRIGAKAEDDGYLLSFVCDMNTKRGEYMILDAANIEAGPVARVVLPVFVPVGTHACWVEGDRIAGEARDPAAVAS